MSHTFIAPLAMTPEQHEHFDSSLLEAKPGVYISFTCGRRDAGYVNCQSCGAPICELNDEWIIDPVEYKKSTADLDPKARGELAGRYLDCERHTPGRATGPIFGPFEYAELTYQWLRVDEGEHLAVWGQELGDWIICHDGPYANESYSDVTIAYYAPKP